VPPEWAKPGSDGGSRSTGSTRDALDRAAAANITPLALLRNRPRLPFVEPAAGVQNPCMRGMFLTYLVVIVGGCGACIVIGLTQ
jgi:hypothetical protein